MDNERDHCAAVVKETAKLWATHFKDFDEQLAVKGRRVLQPFIDFDFSTHESMVAENSKLLNIEQVLQGSVACELALQTMGLTTIKQMLATKAPATAAWTKTAASFPPPAITTVSGISLRQAT